MNINRLNPNRLSTPAEINEALDAVSAELTRLQKLQERILARKDSVVSSAALKGIPGLIDAEDPEGFIAKLMADAMAYRQMAESGSEDAEKKADVAEDDADASLDDEDDDIFG